MTRYRNARLAQPASRALGYRMCLIATATPRELPPIARARRAYATDAAAPAEWDFRWSSRASASSLAPDVLASWPKRLSAWAGGRRVSRLEGTRRSIDC